MRWLWLALALCAGCAGKPNSPRDNPQPADGWMIRGSKPERILLTNGVLGIWLLTDQGINGQDAFRLFANEVLVPIPQLVFQGEQPLQERESLNWTFDLITGEFVAKRRQGNVGFDYHVVLHPTQPIVAVKWTPSATEATYGRVGSTECALPRLEFGNNTANSVNYRAKSAIEGEAEDLVVTLASNAGSDVLGVLLNGERTPLPETYDEVLAASKKAHEDFWTTDIEIDGPAEDQLAIRTMLYYLRRGATDKLPPFGASNAKYRGARFWDAEAWILPVLAVVDRQKAVEATRWRIDNLGEYVPWEASVGGRDVTPKEFGNALHVAGWVAWWVKRSLDQQLVSEADLEKVLDVVFPQFSKAATNSERGMEIKGVESPDEGKLRDNDLVTN